MGVSRKNAKNSKEAEKERKKRSTRKYGQAILKHSRKGVHSLLCGTASLALLAACIITAFVMRGETYSFIGGLGILSILGAGFGMRSGIKGLREREKRYITCKAGIALNGLILLGLIFIFWGGIR